uniref:Uncharacterized protein n=1 Tax=Picea glauca TaxID=3330 RepID=A0A117NH37_PICGL|nr:hypothetical protein ABT39_MTgene4772 [Picea glauca]
MALQAYAHKCYWELTPFPILLGEHNNKRVIRCECIQEEILLEIMTPYGTTLHKTLHFSTLMDDPHQWMNNDLKASSIYRLQQ